MSDLAIKAFQPKDFFALHLADRPDHREILSVAGFERSLRNLTQHPSYTAWAGDCVVACAGVVILWPGVGEAWVFPDMDQVKKHRVSFHKAVLSYLRIIEEYHNLHRVQTTVWDGFSDGIKWIGRLGFVTEGYLRAYGPKKENYFLYRRLRDVGN